MSVLDLCRMVQGSAIGTGIRESGYVFPFLEGTHVIALAVSVGAAMVFDLRLLGVLFRREPVSKIFDQLKPWMMVGFAVMFTTGALLVSSIAVDAYGNVYFRLKLLLLLLAGANTLVFHTTVDRRRGEWDVAAVPPLQARAAGLLSLVLWTSVIVAGRLFAYAV